MQGLKKKYLSFMMLITLVIGTMTPFFASYGNNISDTTKELAQLLGGKILICTNNGFKWIDIQDLEDEQKNPQSDKYKCPLCYIKSNSPNGTLAKNAIFIPSSSHYTHAVYYQTNDLILTKNVNIGIKTRAPPSSFVI